MPRGTSEVFGETKGGYNHFHVASTGGSRGSVISEIKKKIGALQAGPVIVTKSQISGPSVVIRPGPKQSSRYDWRKGGGYDKPQGGVTNRGGGGGTPGNAPVLSDMGAREAALGVSMLSAAKVNISR